MSTQVPMVSSGWPFVGREQELSELESELHRAASGAFRTMMLIGEPGIGKTRLAEETSAIAVAAGARVAWGRCWDGRGSWSYWPWTQILRSLLKLENQTPGGDSTGLHSEHLDLILARIVPELGSGVRSATTTMPGQAADEDRFFLFDAVGRVLVREARQQPLLLVLDDVHDADASSLLLLQFLIRALRDAPVLVLCTYRDIEVGRDHPHLDLLGHLCRESRRLPLSGLRTDDVARVIESAAGASPSSALVAAVHAHTEGNSFFVNEVVHQLIADDIDVGNTASEAWGLSIPQGVREMIGGHIRQISPDCRAVLDVASVLGREFDSVMVQRSLDVELAGDLTTALEEAVDANLVCQRHECPAEFAFVHSLTRGTIYNMLGTIRRARLHQRVGEAIEAMVGTDITAHLPSLAHHFYEAIPIGALDKAFDYALAAGDNARGRLVHEEAAEYYGQAVRVATLQGSSSGQRADLLSKLGDVLSKSGATARARQAFLDAASEARAAEDSEALAQAALGYGGRFVGQSPGMIDAQLVNLLEEALAASGESDSPIRAILLARLSRAHYYGDATLRLGLSEQALDMATRTGDPSAMIAALHSRYWALDGPGHGDERLAIGTQMTHVAATAGDKEMALQACHWRLVELAEIGDMVGVDLEIATYCRLADEIRQPLYRWYGMQFGVMRATMGGRFKAAEELAGQAMTKWEHALNTVPLRRLLAVQLLMSHLEQGRNREALELFHGEAADSPDPGSRAIAAFAACRLGLRERAGLELASLVSGHLNSRQDQTWMGGAIALAEVCADLGDERFSGPLYRSLLPYQERNAVVSAGLACGGAVARVLGRLAIVEGNLDVGRAHLEHALHLNSQVGAKPALARTQVDLAEVLVHQSPEKRSTRALDLFSQAIALGEELGMSQLVRDALRQRTKALRSTAEARAPKSVPKAIPAPVADNRITRDGQEWVVSFQGTSARLRDSKGLAYLHVLLLQPGRDIHVEELAAMAAPIPPAKAAPRDPGAAGAWQRLEGLRRQLAEASDRHDDPKAEALRREIALVADQLAPDRRKGSESRTTTPTEEKARKAVTNRIRAVFANVNDVHPLLALHLEKSIVTGRYCSYRPFLATTWEIG